MRIVMNMHIVSLTLKDYSIIAVVMLALLEMEEPVLTLILAGNAPLMQIVCLSKLSNNMSAAVNHVMKEMVNSALQGAALGVDKMLDANMIQNATAIDVFVSQDTQEMEDTANHQLHAMLSITVTEMLTVCQTDASKDTIFVNVKQDIKEMD